MLAKEVMSTTPEFVSPDTSLIDAAQHMKSHDYGFIPVGENDRLLGALTDRDLVIRAIAEGKDPNVTSVSEVMTDGIQYCFEDDDLISVADKMERLQIRRLVVLDENKRMTGIISLGDIATKANSPNLSSEIIEQVSHH